MRASLLVPTAALVCSLAACKPAAEAAAEANAAPATPVASSATFGMTDAELIARGEYLARIAGCNDCHTPGYPESGGKVPKDQWLVGSSTGWNGPWGTTYPANLRLKAVDMEDAKWLEYSRTLHTRPPMPDFAVRDMTDADRLSLFRLLKSLGPMGEPAPAYLEPGQVPPLPFVQFNPPPPPAAADAQAEPVSGG
ncbi:cytochrome C [Lysobacter sp. A6]|uniref:Cytochrome C n=1 Tax=Noviluteimonas lactosilytica TaxID=2888523 RepID=A0ABS8JK02_9GAMM|nr:cytochrome C [Lysobacter lactosilyticus]MCC8363931.1 cytochrome C [Lysobacter lactosilyticus]